MAASSARAGRLPLLVCPDTPSGAAKAGGAGCRGLLTSARSSRDWERELGDALSAAYRSEQPERAYKEISRMLQTLGDPFTRIVPPM